MTLSDLIPAEFKTACPVAFDATHGRLSVIHPRLPNAGKVLVEWGQQCPKFKTNLADARELKTEGYGTYISSAGGWVFARTAAAACHEKFASTLERTPEFLALLEAPAETTPTPAPIREQRPVGGTLSVIPAGRPYAGQFLAAWDRGSACFSANLEAARSLKAAGFGTYRPEAGGWVFSIAGAAKADAAFHASVLRTPEFAAAVAAATNLWPSAENDADEKNPEGDDRPAVPPGKRDLSRQLVEAAGKIIAQYA